MTDHDSFHRVEIGSERSFGLIFAGVLAVVGALPWLLGHGVVRWWALALAALFLAAALLVPHWLAPLNRAWSKLGLRLGALVSPLVMALVFFLVVTPLAVLARLLGKDFLATGGAARRRDSHWTRRDDDPQHPPSMSNQY
jgi:hypothetical protein